MSVKLLRSELIGIHNLLISKLTSEDLEWLKENRGRRWEGKYIIEKMIIKSDSDPFYLPKIEISFSIQDMVDAKLREKLRQGKNGKLYNRKEMHYKGELTTGRTVEIAMILGVLEGPRKNKFQILGRIMELVPSITV